MQPLRQAIARCAGVAENARILAVNDTKSQLGLVTVGAVVCLGVAIAAWPATQTTRAHNTQQKSAPSPKPKQPAATEVASPSDRSTSGNSPAPVEGIRANNLGVVLMDARNFPEAAGRFQTACIMAPDTDAGCLNAGIAFLAMKQYEQARQIFTISVRRDAQSPRAWFNLGLLERAQNHADAAISDFQKAAALDPGDAATQCEIGQVYAVQQDYDRALTAFREALRLDRLNATAEHGISDALAKKGDREGQKTHLDRYTHLTSLGLSKPLGENYGEQGKYSLAVEIPPPNVTDGAIAVRFADVTQSAGLVPMHHAAPSPVGRGAPGRSLPPAKPFVNASAATKIHTMADFLGSGACVFDYDGDGRPDIFLVDADGTGDAALFHNLGHGRFADVTKASKIDLHGAGMGCAVGDYDDDGHPDLAVSANGIRLYHNEGNGTFKDVTDASRIRADGLVMGICFVDYDRDGDLDLYVTRFQDFPLAKPSQPFVWPENDAPPGNMLWRNNGDGTFSDVTATLGLAGNASTSNAIASDFAGNGALDLFLTGRSATPSMLMNPREGTFKPAAMWGAETQGPSAGAVAFDFDKDGEMDVAVTHWAPTTLGLWRNVGGKSFKRVALPDPGWMRAWGIAALDYDSDGWIDLTAVGETFSGESRIVLLRNEAGKGFHDVTAETGLDKITLHDPRSVIAFDADGDGSVNLLITQNRRPPVLLKATGGEKHNWAEIALRGDRENTMALGVKVEMFSGALGQTWEIPCASGYLSQGPSTIFMGLGDEGAADAVRVFWSRGPIQVEIPVERRKLTTVAQQDAGASR
jgi:cytochrome c-type biogenesis protein CcmH/NrfG